jgi:hypothetical protein
MSSSHRSGDRLSVRDNRLVRMALIPASIAAPHVVDRRLRLPLLHLERRDQGVLRRYGHGSPLASDVYADCEFERHARILLKGVLHITQ